MTNSMHPSDRVCRATTHSPDSPRLQHHAFAVDHMFNPLIRPAPRRSATKCNPLLSPCAVGVGSHGAQPPESRLHRQHLPNWGAAAGTPSITANPTCAATVLTVVRCCRMDAGVEHFGRLLKRAFELPLSGMSISLMFSLSHAHIEGAAQLRRWGKAEDTIGKLKEIAEFTSENKIPNAIESISDRLHLWWREKRANIYSRQVRLPTCGSRRYAFLCASISLNLWLCSWWS